ncbi:MAG TPA: transaldolase [Acetobacteraceae bacterium]|nr:transaldolase [Acetobacteraceae bacterium]
MNATAKLRAAGQSLWLDDITRDLLDSGTLQHYIQDLSVTGLTSNPSIFDHAITHSKKYDDEIRRLTGRGYTSEALFFELALEDLSRAADMFLPIHEATAGTDGWVSLEVSPLLAYQTDETIAEARRLSRRANKSNLFIKIPGTKEGLPAIEQAIAAGVPVNVTLLFSPAQYEAAADAYMRGLEQRIAAGLAPDVRSVASVFISRWDRAVADKVPAALQNTLGDAIGQLAYKSYRELLDSNRWQRLMNHGAVPQRLLFASTSMKDPKAPDAFYVNTLAAPNTVNTMPAPTLVAFADHGNVGSMLSRDGGDGAATIAQHAKAGIDVDALAAKLQSDGAQAFVESWKDLLQAIDTKSRALGLQKVA